jgi:hypothetical protein
VDTLAEQATTAAKEMGSQSTAALESEKNAALAQIQTWQEQASSAVEQAGNQLQDPLTAQLSSLQETLTSYGASAAAQLRSVEQPDPNKVQEAAASFRQNIQESHNAAIVALEEWKGNTQTELTGQSENLNLQLSELVSDRTAAAQDTGSKMVQALQEAAQNAATGMESSTTSFQEKLTASIDTAVEQMMSAGEQFRSQVQSTHQQAMSAFSQLVDDGLTSEDNLIAKARQDMSSAVGQIGGKYEELKSEAEQRSASQEETPATRIHRGIWGDIWGAVTGFVDSVRKWFADTFGEFWGGLLFGILAGLVIVAVGWLAMTGLGGLLVALGVSAKVAAIVVLVVGLVVAIPLAIYNRFQEFYADNPGQNAGFWRGLGLVTLGILDLTGIPFVVEGLVGQRAFGKKLEGFERWERFGMGIVFLGAFLVSAKNLLRGKPKPQIEEPAGKLPERPVPKPSETAPPGMSETLRTLRSSLKDPRAIEQFDQMFGRMKGDSAKMERIIEGLQRSGDLEERLIRDWEAANPTPRGEALSEVPGLKARAEALQSEIQAYRDANPEVEGISEMLKAVKGEVNRLNDMLAGKIEATPEGVQGTRNNINGAEAEFRNAQAETGVTGVNRKFSLDGEPNKVEVDVVSDKGHTWIDSKRVEPFGLESSDWVGKPGKQGLRVQAQEMLRAASQNPVNGVPPKVVFDFPLGVSREVAKALRTMGIEVRGSVVDPHPRPLVPVMPPSNGEEQQ